MRPHFEIMILMKKSILIVLAMLAVVLQAGAVLKESNMEQTLGVLCEELSETQHWARLGVVQQH